MNNETIGGISMVDSNKEFDLNNEDYVVDDIDEDSIKDDLEFLSDDEMYSDVDECENNILDSNFILDSIENQYKDLVYDLRRLDVHVKTIEKLNKCFSILKEVGKNIEYLNCQYFIRHLSSIVFIIRLSKKYKTGVNRDKLFDVLYSNYLLCDFIYSIFYNDIIPVRNVRSLFRNVLVSVENGSDLEAVYNIVAPHI